MVTNILPSWISKPKCYSSRCLGLLCEKDIDLIPNIVNEVIITNDASYNSNFIMHVDHHLYFNSTYRILNEYLYYSEIENVIKIPIVTSHFYQLKADEILCHFRFVPPCQALWHILGNYFLFYFFNLSVHIFFNLELYKTVKKFYISETQEEYFMSDSEGEGEEEDEEVKRKKKNNDKENVEEHKEATLIQF